MLTKSASGVPRLAEAASRGRSRRLEVCEARFARSVPHHQLGEACEARGFAAPGVDAGARRASRGITTEVR